MRIVALSLVGALAIAATVWALCNYVLFPDVVLSYRLTAEVTLRGKTYTGSAVVETQWSQTLFNPLGLADNWTEREKGEAVVVDMAEDGVVLVTLAGYTQQQPKLLPQMVYGKEKGGWNFRTYLQALARDRLVKQLKPDDIPVVIWLKDRFNPSSATCVEPDGSAGASVVAPSFPRLQMQMVEESPTEKIDTVLPWLGPILTDPNGEINYRFVLLKRHFPERLCYCAPRDLKRNQL